MQSSVSWYRYEDVLTGDDWGTYVRVLLREFVVVKETPKGVWLSLPMFEWGGMKKFVLKNSRKRYACPTKEEAMVSFLARKRKQAKILTAKLKNVNDAVREAEAMCLTKNLTLPENSFGLL